MISSGDQDGPQPPEKHAVAAGTSKTSTIMGVVMWDPLLGERDCLHRTHSDTGAAAGATLRDDRPATLIRSYYGAFWARSAGRATGLAVAAELVDGDDGHVVLSFFRCG